MNGFGELCLSEVMSVSGGNQTQIANVIDGTQGGSTRPSVTWSSTDHDGIRATGRFLKSVKENYDKLSDPLNAFVDNVLDWMSNY